MATDAEETPRASTADVSWGARARGRWNALRRGISANLAGFTARFRSRRDAPHEPQETVSGHVAGARHEIPPGKPRRRWHVVRWAVIAVCVLAVYPVVGTLMLWTGLAEKLLKSEDLVVEIENPAWTLWPGHVHVASARILVNGETQFELRARDLLVKVKVWRLPWKHLHVTSLEAADVRYFMRVQVDDERGIEERLAAYPKLEDLPGDATVKAKKGQKTEEREGNFTVEVDGIDVDVAELWFMEYHYVGDATLRGGFLIGPNRMRIGTSVQELGPGDLRFGRDQIIAKNFRGRIEAAVPEVNPEEHADASFLELVTANIALTADVQTLKHVGAYLQGMDIADGAGPFRSRILLEKGHLGDGSRITFDTKKVILKGKGFSVLTDWDLDTQVSASFEEEPRPEGAEPRANAAALQRKAASGGEAPKIQGSKPAAQAKKDEKAESVLPRLRSKAKSTYVSFANENGDVFTVQVHNHQQDATLKSKQLGSMTDIQRASVRFPEIVTGDMDDLAALSSGSSKVESKRGTARASLFLDVDEKHVARGPFKANLDGLRMIVAGIDVRGEGTASLGIVADIDKKAASFEDIAVKLTDIDVSVKDERVDDWWLVLSSQRVSMWGVPPTRIEADVTARARNAEPFLQTLAAKGELNDLIADLIAINDLRVRGKVRKRGETLDVVLEPFESSLVDVAGRFYSKGDSNQMAIVVGGKAVSLGIAKDKGGLSLMPFAREGWLNERLRAFPGPEERVERSQP